MLWFSLTPVAKPIYRLLDLSSQEPHMVPQTNVSTSLSFRSEGHSSLEKFEKHLFSHVELYFLSFQVSIGFLVI